MRRTPSDGERDFTGYGRHAPAGAWPGEARIAISILLNVEEGSELSVLDGDAHGEAGAELPREARIGRRDLAVESVFEYGARAGIWRLLRIIEDQGVRATIACTALAVRRNPDLARYLSERNHEVMAHGYRWEDVSELGESIEREHIRETVDSLSSDVGRRPLGWFSRYSPSVHTRRLLVEEGGFEYDSDSCADDLPYFVEVAGTAWCVVPHSFDTSDLRFWRGSLSTGTEYEVYLRETFDCLYSEGRSYPRMMTVSLHGRASGRPGRAGGVERFLRYTRSKPGVWFATRVDIARAWARAVPRDPSSW